MKLAADPTVSTLKELGYASKVAFPKQKLDVLRTPIDLTTCLQRMVRRFVWTRRQKKGRHAKVPSLEKAKLC
jgi:hypothetical protein